MKIKVYPFISVIENMTTVSILHFIMDNTFPGYVNSPFSSKSIQTKFNANELDAKKVYLIRSE